MYRKALVLLANDRPEGYYGSLGPIPFGSYDTFARRYGIKGGDFDKFCYIMGRLDDVCLEIISKQRKKGA